MERNRFGKIDFRKKQIQKKTDSERNSLNQTYQKIVYRNVSKAASVLLDALFPRRCPVCGQIPGAGEVICPPCLKKLSFVSSPVCKKCGKEIISETMEYCLDCTRHRRSFESGISLLNYNEAASRSMAAVKYKNKREYLDFYADEAVRRCGWKLRQMNADCLVPVPVHPRRQRTRGFNQAEILAEKLGVRLDLPVVTDVLGRRRDTEPQKSLSPAERLKNLEKAFTASPVSYKRILLVDDIYTTGSTIEACSRALLKAGAEKIYFFTVCIGQGQ